MDKIDHRMSTLESPTNIPSLPLDFSAWNLTWVMKDSSPFFPHSGQHVFDCNFELPCELEYSPPLKDKENHNRTWHRVSAEELNFLDGPKRDHSEDSPRGSFLFLNTSESMSPIILSPWLRSSSEQCTMQVSVYRHLQQSGDYIARLLPADESSSEILLAPSQEKHGECGAVSESSCTSSMLRSLLKDGFVDPCSTLEKPSMVQRVHPSVREWNSKIICNRVEEA
ncbi:ALK tyrosine kinase receptor-like [Trachemys scripta elegans]|uniref:ALK tyrosine kinase receptor-like n=1 Tax=Trachemys scripta elegans TaxID=31138 RepID=UPI001551E49F|nr:ALK tyrosine kinase receptor-like [Trachemys scripta elegans]